jgi:hypothetical protein
MLVSEDTGVSVSTEDSVVCEELEELSLSVAVSEPLGSVSALPVEVSPESASRSPSAFSDTIAEHPHTANKTMSNFFIIHLFWLFETFGYSRFKRFFKAFEDNLVLSVLVTYTRYEVPSVM